jgi:hypothetical protein
MSPKVLLVVLLLLGALAGAFLTIKPSPPTARPEEAVSLFPPTAPVTNDKAEIARLEDLVANLEGQLKALTQENAQLLQKLGSLGMKEGPQPVPTEPKPSETDYVALGQALAKLRGLDPTPLPTRPATEDEVKASVLEWLLKHHGKDFGMKEGTALCALGLIPEVVDTLTPRAQLLARQLSGWYDAAQQTILVIPPHKEEGGTPIVTDPALAIGFSRLLALHGDALFTKDYAQLSSDERQARLGLFAGDAALIRFLRSITNPSAPDPNALPPDDPDHPLNQIPSPDYVRQRDLFSLTYGFEFAQTLHSAGEWGQLAKAYKQPPATTAEIFDTERYLTESGTTVPPMPIEIAPSTEKPIWDDRLGQFALFYYLKRYMEPEEAHAAAAQWRGDRLVVFEAEPRGSAVWKIHAVTEEGATKLHAALKTALLQHADLPEDTPLPHNGERSIHVTQNKSVVTLIDAASAEVGTRLSKL